MSILTTAAQLADESIPGSIPGPGWRDEAACREADPETFFPEGADRFARGQVNRAKLICRGCPVAASCLSWALASGHEWGIWGGLTEEERRGLSRRMRAFWPPADQQCEE